MGNIFRQLRAERNERTRAAQAAADALEQERISKLAAEMEEKAAARKARCADYNANLKSRLSGRPAPKKRRR